MPPRAANEVILKHHALYVAQRRRCYLCDQPIVNSHLLPRDRHPSSDHVRPRAKGGTLYRNRLLAHAVCNRRKGSRMPRPCETLYLEAMNEIMDWRRYERAYGTDFDLSYVQGVGLPGG